MVFTRKSVFDTPAIVKLVDAHLIPRDSAALACTSRQLFQTVTPLLWERVNVSRLCKLLPVPDDIKKSDEAIEPPNKVWTQNNLHRFNVYAPWIKHLSVGESKPQRQESFEIFCRYSPQPTILPNLVSLTWSIEALDHACFTAISTFPSLKSLKLSLNPYKGNYELPELPDSAFPSLTHLGLDWLPDSDTFHTFWAVPALVSKLTSVSLMPSGDMCREKNQFVRVLRPILEKLVKRSPKMEDLQFRAIDPDAMRAWYRVPISALEVLQKVPLRKLWIEGVELSEPPMVAANHAVDITRQDDHQGNQDDPKAGGVEGEDEDEDEDENENGSEGDEDEDEDPEEERLCRCSNLAERLSAMFPTLIELGFPRHMLPLSEIPILHSNMPGLETLRFDFELRKVSKLKVELGGIPRHRHTLPFTFEANFMGVDESIQIPGISGFKHNDAILFAQYLFSFWPNVRIVELPDEEEEAADEYPERLEMIGLVNDYLEALARCNRDPSMNYEDIEVLTEESWSGCFE